MNLYEISNNYRMLQMMLQDEEADQQAIIDTLESMDFELEDKADNYARIIRNLEAEVTALKDEEQRLSNRRKSRENNIKVLKANLEQAMILTGKRDFKTDLFSFKISKNGGAMPVVLNVPVEEIPEEYFKARKETDVDKTSIRKALEEGKIDFASFGERGESLRIK